MKHKVEIHKDALCPICSEKILTEEKTLSKPILQEAELGVVHMACLMPFYPEEKIKVLFKIRCYSIGDTIAATPVLRELRRLHPKATINVLTFYPDIFKFNPHVNGIFDLNSQVMQTDVDSHHFQIDSFDEKKSSHFACHSVEYSSQCGLNRSIHPSGWQYDLNYSEKERSSASKILSDHGVNIINDKVILIHPHKTEWKTRDWGVIHFPELAKKIAEKYPDYKLISIGGKRAEVPVREMKNHVEIENVIDLYGKFSLLESSAMMDFPCMKLLVTPDTGTLHLAGARPELPIVGIFTLIRPFFRTPVRNGVFGYKFIGVSAESGCNCTYTNRPLTNEMNFGVCPKRTMLEKTKELPINNELKCNGLSYIFPGTDWKSEDLNKLIDKELEEYGDDLPCFPSVEKVMVAVESLLSE